MRPVLRKKKGVLALDIVRDVMLFLLILAVIGVAIILATVSLRDSNIFTADSQEQNDTNAIVGNISEGVVDFFSNTTTIMSILIVVVIILAISIIIGAVSRFGSVGGNTQL